MNQSKDSGSEQRATPERSFIVVGIGASAGGLEALEAFLEHLPAESGMALVLVQHLDPTRASLMPELLARHTKMPIKAVEDGMAVGPNCLYVMPPNVTLTIKNGVLKMITPVEPATVRSRIDTFFRSLAEDHAERAIGVVLSGAGSDGTLGLKAIKEHGGVAVAQSPESAKYDSMPLSAIATGLVDYILAVEEIPAKLVECAEYMKEMRQRKSVSALHEETGAALPRICEILRHATGHDFSGYKPSTMVRRTERRMQVQHVDSVAAYVAKLEQDAQEAEQLFKDLLIGVTQFFRDGEVFDALASQVIPKILEDKGSDARVRVWVPGCASGEEAYSIAILLSECMAKLNIAPTVQVFATDIDDEAIDVARQGRYSASSIEQVSAQRRERFFTRHGDVYLVNKQVRDLCVFSIHDLVRDPPFSALDLISCRNLMIYMDAGLQKRLIPLFHYALVPGGYLLLGSSEGVAGGLGLFRDVDKKQRVFQRIETVVRPAVMFPLGELSESRGHHAQVGEGKRLPSVRPQDIGAVVERMALEYAPPCVVINERGEIIYGSGETSLYLQQPTGSPTLNIIDQARKGLRLSLRTAIRQASKSGETVVQAGLVVKTPAGVQSVDLIVRPVVELGAGSPLLAVVFQTSAKGAGRAQGQTPASDESVVAQLESELKTTRGELQTAVEELEAANEDLKSSNEELMSMNEEMQSANEELQTSKEEMQSINEELGTVNAELNRKVEQLDTANGDLANLIRSTQIPTLFLDRDLRIKRFTPAATTIFHLIGSDEGRPISDLAPRFADGDLINDMKQVLQTLAVSERQAYLPETKSWYMVRMLPSRTVGDVVDGVVVTFVDITALKQGEESLEKSEERLRLLVEGVKDYAIFMLDAQGRVATWNRGAEQLKGYTTDEILGEPFSRFYTPEDQAQDKPSRELAVAREQGQYAEEGWRVRKDGSRFWASVTITALRDAAGELRGFAKVTRDITERKRAEEALRESEERLRMVFETMTEGFTLAEIVLDEAGKPRDLRYLAVNPAFERHTGLKAADTVGRTMLELFPGAESEWIERYGKVVLTGEPGRFEGAFGPLGRWFDVSAFRTEPGRFAVIFTDITDRKRAEGELKAAVEFMHLLNASPRVHELVEASVRFFRQQSGCEAVGIRLRDGDDYPYYETHGFPEEFVRMESSLCVRCETGDVERDSEGNPVMACMCGNVICGRFDPSKPFFSSAGSFWTNSTTDLLASTTDADRQARTRNRCNGEGYESVALIALRVGDDRLGLLQLNDRRRNVFTPEIIALWERLAGYLAIALAHARAEEALRESEERFRTMADAMSQLAWIAKPDGWIHWYNRRWYEYTGTTPQQMEGWGWQSVHDPEALPKVLEQWKASIASGEPFEMVFPLRGADGRFRPFLTRGQPLKDAQGRVVQWFGTNTDVEELKRAEESLRESEQFARLLVECNRDCVKVLDLDGKLLSMSQNGQKMMEIADLTPYLNASYTDFWRPEDQEHVREMVAAARGGGVGRFEGFCPTASGKPRWWDVDLTPIPGPEGKPQRLLAVSHDITERKQREVENRRLNRTLRALTDSSQIIGQAKEEKEYLAQVCHSIMENCGHAMVWIGYAEMDPGRSVRPVAWSGFEDGYLETLDISWADTERGRGPTGTAIRTGQVRICRNILTDPLLAPWRDEAVKRGYRSSMALPLAGREGTIGALTLYSMETDPFTESEVKLLEELAEDVVRGIESLRLRGAQERSQKELREAKEGAEQASKAKDHFLAVLSHELRNPLNPVLATASMLRASPKFDADTREQLEVICRNAELEARLIDDLLDVTRIERGKVELDRRPTQLCMVINRAAEVCRPDLEARKVEFGIDLGPSPYWVDADAARLQQVFWNLLKNAIKFTPVGGCVGIRCRPDGEGFAVVQVQDSGEGIEPEAMGRIFNAFEQAERSITRQFGGLGLGLTISKAMVEMHGGTIEAQSDGKGKGATFTVRLPLLPAGVAPSTAPTFEAAPPAAAARPLRILLVEDHGDTARIMQRILSADGHDVQTAADVDTALKLAGKQTFDLLLSDLGLPDGSGLDLMRALRKRGLGLPAIALSGFGLEQDIQQSREAGFVEHMVKPVSIPRLEEAIARISQNSARNTARD